MQLNLQVVLRSLLFILALVVLILTIILSKGWHAGLDAWFGGYADRAIVKTADPACNPTLESCTVDYDNLSMTLRLEGEVKPLVPFSIQLSLKGWNEIPVDRVSVLFTMVGMNMGVNRFELERRDDAAWYGQALLPICTRGRRDWRIQVEIAGEQSYRAEFYTVVDSGPGPK